MILRRIKSQSGLHKSLWLACLASIFFTAAVFLHAERLPIKTYTVADGLPRDNVNRIRHDSRGFLWFCTADGISRFDGYSFTNFTTGDGLPDRHVNDFLETKAGIIYVATDAGLAELNPKGLSGSADNPLFTVILPENERAKIFQVLFEDAPSGEVWAGTRDGLYKFNDRNKLAPVDLRRSVTGNDVISINAIIRDRRGAMWVGTEDSGLLRILPTGEIERFTKENGLPDAHISSLLEDKNGRIWVGLSPHYGGGLCLLAGEPQKNQKVVERCFSTAEGLPSPWVTDLYEDEDKFWIATTRGLCLWQGADASSVCKTYTAKNDLCDYDVWTITKDKDGNLWTGSKCGAKKWARYGFTSYSETDGTANPLVNSIFENASGELFVSFNDGDGRAVSRFNGEKFELVKPNFSFGRLYFGSGWRQTVRQDSAADWWFPTGHGLFRFSRISRFEDLARITPQKINIETKGTEIYRLYEDSRGDVWITTISTANELWRWERKTDTWHDLTEEAGFGKNRVGLSFVEDKSGNLWIGTGESDSALIRYRDGQFKIFTRRDGIPEGWQTDLFVDHAGKLWIANPAAGVLRLDDVNSDEINFTRYTPAEGLSSIGVSCITEDEFGRIYIGTGRGLDRLEPETGQIENFTTADGLPNSLLEVAYRDRKNNLWFGTANGLARFIPEPARRRQSPNIFITGLRVSGVSLPVSILGETMITPFELDSDQKQVAVDFLGLGASLGEKLKYEYRFGESEWTETHERTVNFANLGAGKYQFEVRAQTADRLYSQSATVAFRIAAPVWQRWWFITALIILTALLVYVFYRFRLSRLLEVANMRTRIATDLHDDIGANLTKIAILSEVAQQQLGQKIIGNGKANLLGSVAEISRESVSAMGDIVWAINPKKDSLLDLTRRMRSFAEEILERREIRLEFNAPFPAQDLKLDANIRRNIYLIFKESINNIVRHSDAAAVKIDFLLADKELVLQIRDDGIGFDSTREFDGNGLLSIKKRAEDCGGRLDLDSVEGAGTKIVLRVKLKSAAWTWH
ncbi:MAG TPA: two-component regulator propeller domain-containing protein [Pyrinomonadaceae bacterium]|jgi:ligand-binding sensor domain-containing protein